MHWVRRSLPPGRPARRRASGCVARARAARRRRLHDRDARPLVARRRCSARTPFVIKLTADPAFERARALGPLARLARGVPARSRAAPTLPLRLARDADVRRAAHVVTPSAYLRELALGWGVPRRARDACCRTRRRRCRSCARARSCGAELGLDGPTLAFAGRLTAQKSLDLGIEAARRAGVALVIAGDGPDRAALERLGHARFLGPLPRRGGARALPRRRRVAALVGVGELPAHGRRGARGRDARDRDAHRRRRRGRRATARTACSSSRATWTRSPPRSTASSPTPELAARLRANAARLGRRLRARAGLRAARARSCVGRPARMTRASSSSAGRATGCRSATSLARKWDALSARMDVRVLASGTGSDPRFRLVPPRRARRAALLRVAARSRRAASCARSGPTSSSPRARTRRSRPSSRARLARSRAKVVVEVHGDWHVSTRLYGSRLRAPARARWATASPAGRCAAPTATAPVSAFTASLARAPRAASRPACSRPTPTSARSRGPRVPVPEEPRVLFVGVLERYKNVEGLAAAWRIVAARVPGARAAARRQRDAHVEVAEGLARDGVELGPPARAGGGRRARSTRRGRCCSRRLRGAAAGRDRGVPARARGRRRARRRDPRHRRGRASTACSSSSATPQALARAIERILTEHELARAARRAARRRGRRLGLDAGGVRRPRPRGRRARVLAMKPRLLIVARTRYALPLPDEPRAEVRGAPGAVRPARARDLGRRTSRATTRLPARRPAAAARRAALLPAAAVAGPPARCASTGRRRSSTQSPYEAALVRRVARGARLVVELHGDWRTATRLYGSPLRRVLSPRSPTRRRLRRPPRRRGAHDLGVHDGARPRAGPRARRRVRRVHRPRRLHRRAGRRCPREPRAPLRRRARALQEHRGARRGVAPGRCPSPRRPPAPGRAGTQQEVVESLAREGVEWERRLDASEVAAAMDAPGRSSCPRRSEGLPRIVIEAFMRGRAVVGSRAGGIPDIVEDGVNGLLVPPAIQPRSPRRSSRSSTTTTSRPAWAPRRPRAPHAGSRRRPSTPTRMAGLVGGTEPADAS